MNLVSLRTSLLFLLASSATVSAEKLRAVWSSGSYSTIAPKGGDNSHGYSTGFAILNSKGEAVYDKEDPGWHSACLHTNGGRKYTLEGSCWDTPRKFHCKSSFAGHPESCEVWDDNGKSLGKNEGKTETKFVGIAIGQDATCVVEFEADGDGCPALKDGEDSEIHFTG